MAQTGDVSELAYAAGFFDSGGVVRERRRGDGSVFIEITISSPHESLLGHLRDVLQAGAVRPRETGSGGRYFLLVIVRKGEVRSVAELLRPHVRSPVHREAFDRLLASSDPPRPSSCAAPGCTDAPTARLLCSTHYRRARRRIAKVTRDGDVAALLWSYYSNGTIAPDDAAALSRTLAALGLQRPDLDRKGRERRGTG